jgi:hypothetical protein
MKRFRGSVGVAKAKHMKAQDGAGSGCSPVAKPWHLVATLAGNAVFCTVFTGGFSDLRAKSKISQNWLDFLTNWGIPARRRG